MAHLNWTTGGEADVLLFQGEKIELSSTVPSAPGTPFDGVLAPSGVALRVKVHGCRKQGEAFRIHGRVIDLRRDLRALLSELVAPSGPAL